MISVARSIRVLPPLILALQVCSQAHAAPEVWTGSGASSNPINRYDFDGNFLGLFSSKGNRGVDSMTVTRSPAPRYSSASA
jgi:hypothetical protein